MTFVATKLFHKAGEGSGGGGGGGDQHNLGWYATESALTTAHPTATAGDWAIVGSTDTVWLWDTDNEEWVDSDQKGQVTSVNGQTGAVTVDTLPDQTGQSGKFLTTDGTDATWSDKPLVNKDTHFRGLVVGSNDDTSGTGNTVIGSNSTSFGGNCNTVLGAFSQGRNASTVIGYGIQDSISQNAVIIRSGAQYSGRTVTGVSDAFCWIKGTTVYELFSADGTIPAARHASLPAADGTYTLQLVIADGVPTLSWVAV